MIVICRNIVDIEDSLTVFLWSFENLPSICLYVTFIHFKVIPENVNPRLKSCLITVVTPVKIPNYLQFLITQRKFLNEPGFYKINNPVKGYKIA